MDKFREEKVKKFEEFIDRQLKVDLANSMDDKDKVLEQQKILFVDIGLGFHAEFTWPEALDFISAREEWLAKKLEKHTHKIASIKAHIKMVYEGIRELLQIPG